MLVCEIIVIIDIILDYNHLCSFTSNNIHNFPAKLKKSLYFIISQQNYKKCLQVLIVQYLAPALSMIKMCIEITFLNQFICYNHHKSVHLQPHLYCHINNVLFIFLGQNTMKF
jgi:hypothetical protein